MPPVWGSLGFNFSSYIQKNDWGSGAIWHSNTRDWRTRGLDEMAHTQVEVQYGGRLGQPLQSNHYRQTEGKGQIGCSYLNVRDYQLAAQAQIGPCGPNNGSGPLSKAGLNGKSMADPSFKNQIL